MKRDGNCKNSIHVMSQEYKKHLNDETLFL